MKKTNSNTPPAALYIGLDVHKEKTVIALLDAARESEPRDYGSVTTSQYALERVMRRIAKSNKLELSQLHVCYEASGCGFWIARRFEQMGIRCDVIAPSLIPTRSGDRVKTDKRDAAKLAKSLRANDLVAVNIPDETDEAIRGLCRARTDAVDDLRRAKTRLLAFLRYLGYNYTGKTHWTEAHKRYLRELRFTDKTLNIILENYIASIEESNARVALLEGAMLAQLDDWQRKPLVEAVMAFKGFKLVAAMVIVSEPERSGDRRPKGSPAGVSEANQIGTFSRFEHPKKLMAYLGLVPTENTSANSRKQGGISKCGNASARWIIIESATHYRMPPKVSAALSKRQEGRDEWIKSLSWNTQLRLNKRHKQLTKRGLHHNKTKVAVARELLSFIWELGTKMEARQDADRTAHPKAKTTRPYKLK